MSWQKWVLVAFTALAALLNVSVIGKPRKPLTPGLAVTILLLDAGYIALVVTS